MKRTMIPVFSAFLIIAVSSCIKDETANQKADEKRILDNYIMTNYPGITPASSGLYYIEEVAGTGDSAVYTNWVEIKYTGRLVYNNSVVMSSDIQVAKDNNFYSAGVYYGPARLILGNISIPGLNIGISMMKEGGKARLILPSDLALGSRSAQNIPAYSSIIFDVELVKVIPDIREYEKGLMMDYLLANEISTDTTSTGVYFKETTAGTGELPVASDKVTVTYVGKFLNGTVFDGAGTSFTISIGYGEAIPGFEAGVKMIRKGGTGTVVIPNNYAYGEYGRVDSNYRTVIPPFSTLVFDITVVEIAKK